MIQTVLAIDDSRDILSLLSARLKPEEVRFVTAQDFETGFARARAELPDLILLDVELEEANGLDLCRRLKADELTAGIPIIFLTAAADVATKVHGFDLGAIDYVTKPFHPAELRARVRAALRLKRSQDLLAERAHVDEITGLRNRAFFERRLEADVLTAKHHGHALTLVMFDLDHFKSLNDTFGHPFGDLVLQRVGDEAARSVRAADAACRYGGEELALVLAHTTEREGLLVAERLRERIANLVFSPRSERVIVTASFGVAGALEVVHRTGGLDRGALVDAADTALYQAKSAGRNCVRSWSPRSTVPLTEELPPSSSVFQALPAM